MLDCGNEIMGCIRTMYWELGWGSVSWWVGQAIFGAPWALGTIAGCDHCDGFNPTDNHI